MKYTVLLYLLNEKEAKMYEHFDLLHGRRKQPEIGRVIIASNGNTLRGHQTEFRLLHVKRLISDYVRVVIVARTTEWPLALADQGGPVDSTVQLL